MGLFQRLKLVKVKKNEITDRRSFCREAASLRINYQTADNMLRLGCRSKDICEGGIRISLFQKLSIGRMAKLYIHLQDNEEPVLTLGRIAWTKETPTEEYPFESGIRLIFLIPQLPIKLKIIRKDTC